MKAVKNGAGFDGSNALNKPDVLVQSPLGLSAVIIVRGITLAERPTAWQLMKKCQFCNQ